MHKRVLLNLIFLFAAVGIAHAGVVEVPRTGQTVSYAAGDDGALSKGVAWPLQRFWDMGDGTVIDNLTGLMWVRDANCIKTSDPDFDTDGTAGDGLVTWQHALDFIAGVNNGTYPACGAGYSDWRLPNRKELRSLVDYSQYNPALPHDYPFVFIPASGYYWMSTAYANSALNAWGLSLYDGSLSGVSKTSSSYVWAVRDAGVIPSGTLSISGRVTDSGNGSGLSNVTVTLSNGQDTVTDAYGYYTLSGLAAGCYKIQFSAAGYAPQTQNIYLTTSAVLNIPLHTHPLIPRTGQTVSYAAGDDGALSKGVAWPVPRFIDYGNGTVLDQLTGFIWTKSANIGGGPLTWQGALNYITGMNNGTNTNYGYADWRLPNRKELRSLVDYSQYNPALPYNHPFPDVQVSGYYWTSTAYANSASNAWGLSLYDGSLSGVSKTSSSYVWAVRGGVGGDTETCVWSPSCKNSSVSGTIKNSATGSPMSGITIVVDFIHTATTDSAGHYAISGLACGTHTVRVNAPGYYDYVYNVDTSVTSVLNVSMIEVQPAALYGTMTPSGYSKDPVNTATGNYVYSRKDFVIPGKGMPLVFERHYNSQDAQDGPLGYGWSHTYNTTLAVNVQGTVTVRWGDGKVETWTQDGSGGFIPQQGLFDTLIDHGDGNYTLKKKDQSQYNFDVSGRFVSIVDKNGNTVSLTYTSGNLTQMTDTAGRQIAYTYDANNRIIQITDPIDRTIGFDYSASGDLISMTDMNGNSTSYTYDANHQVLTIVDPRGNTVVANVYDDLKRVVVSQKDAKQGQTTYSYDDVNRKTTIIDQLGNATIHYHDEQSRLIKEQDPYGNAFSYAYDEAGNRIEVRDKKGNAMRYAYGINGNVITKTDALGNVTAITYDANNNPLTRTDAMGKTTAFAYDAKGNLVTTTDPLGKTSTLTYDTNGLLLTKTDPIGNTTTNTYDTEGNLVQVVDPLGNITQYAYDGVGRWMTATDALGHTTTYTYDNNNNLLAVTDPAGHALTQTYDGNNNRLSATDKMGHVTQFAYDKKDLLIATTDALSGVMTNAYDALDRKVSVTDRNGNTTQYTYDPVGNLIRVTDPLGNITQYVYDPNGNRRSLTDPLGHVSQFTYDALNRQVTASDALGNTTTTAYDAVGRVQSTTNAKGQVTGFIYDALGRLIQVTDANGGTVQYGYDANGNLISMTEPNGNVTTYTYDALNRLITQVEPLGHTTTKQYDAVGNVTQLNDPKGNTIQYSYDNLDRLITKTYPDSSTVSFTYDANGNRTQMVDSLGTTTYTYDALDRMTAYTDPVGKSVAYGYDANGNRTSLTYPGAKVVTYSYDAANRLTQVTDWLARTTHYAYDTAWRLTGATNPNGTSASYGYDDAGRLTSLSNTRSDASVIAGYSYTLDPIGNHSQAVANEPLSPVIPDQTASYTYDAENRITNINGTPNTFDANGNMTGKGSDIFAYDYENRLVQSNVVGVSTQYGYDGLGNRFARTAGGATTRYVLDINTNRTNVLAETDASGSITAYYVYGQGLIAKILPDGTASYYHYDSRGSTIALTDSTENITDSYAYDAFGKLANSQGSTPNPFKYVGGYGVMDEGDRLDYIRARYYSPELGRFISKDPKAGKDNDGQSLNRYVYGLNNPVILIDVSGFSPSEVIKNTTINKDKSSDPSFFNNGLVEGLDSKMLTALVTSTEGALYKSSITSYLHSNALNLGGPQVTGTVAAYLGPTVHTLVAPGLNLVEEYSTHPELNPLERATRFAVDVTYGAGISLATLVAGPVVGIVANAGYEASRENVQEYVQHNALTDYLGEKFYKWGWY